MKMFHKYFVVNPHPDSHEGYASRKAVLAYSEAIYGWDEELACDLRSWIDWIEREIIKRDKGDVPSLEGMNEPKIHPV